MIYIINDEQREIIKMAVENNNHIQNLRDLKWTESYEALIQANKHQIPQSVVNREIAYLKCNAQNADQLAEFRRSNEYACFATWSAGEIENIAMGLVIDLGGFEDREVMRIFQLITNLARIAREKASRRASNGGGPGSDREFRKALNTALRFLKIEPDDY